VISTKDAMLFFLQQGQTSKTLSNMSKEGLGTILMVSTLQGLILFNLGNYKAEETTVEILHL
jgi:hypothetical protein